MEERMRILEQIEGGQISVGEGARRLELLEDVAAAEPGAPHADRAQPIARPGLLKWAWQIVLWIGVGLMVWGGWLLAMFYTREATTARAVWGWILLVLGTMGVLGGWWLQRAQWLHVRVCPSEGPHIFLALPLPLGLVAGVLRIARPFVPQLEEMKIDEILLAFQDEIKRGQPFSVEVDEGKGGNHVQVYCGSIAD